MNNKRLITTIIFLLISTAVIWFGFYYNVTFYGKHFAQNIPKTIDGMNSREIIMDQHTLDILETEDVLFREYRRHGEFENPLYLCIIFSENNRKVAHPPELCLSGGGNIVEEKKEIRFDSEIKNNFDAQRLIVTSGHQKSMYLYWYKSGKFSSSNYLLQQFFAAAMQLVYRKSSCALIRISAPIPPDEEPPYHQTEQRVVEFSKKVIPLIAKELP